MHLVLDVPWSIDPTKAVMLNVEDFRDTQSSISKLWHEDSEKVGG